MDEPTKAQSAKLRKLLAEYAPDSIAADIITDALDSDPPLSYLRDVTEHGCVSGTCRGLVYYAQTHEFFTKHADEIDELLTDLADQYGEPVDLKIGTTDLRNQLAWLAYEENAHRILEKVTEEPDEKIIK